MAIDSWGALDEPSEKVIEVNDGQEAIKGWALRTNRKGLLRYLPGLVGISDRHALNVAYPFLEFQKTFETLGAAIIFHQCRCAQPRSNLTANGA